MNSKLRTQLTQFGLDPREWMVEIRSYIGSSLLVDVHSHVHPDLEFTGWATRGQLLRLSLVS